jgi:hypothetical protein
MDKITSHIIQMNSNPRSPNSRVSDIKGLGFRGLGLEGLGGFEHVGFEGVGLESLRGLESKSFVSDLRPGLGGSGPETSLGFDFPGL